MPAPKHLAPATKCKLKPNAEITRQRAKAHATEQGIAQATQQAAAHADRDDTGIDNLIWNLVDFLVYVFRENSIDDCLAMHDDCLDIIYAQIEDWSANPTDTNYYNEAALSLHHKLWDVVRRNKYGVSKENKFIEWCRIVHSHSEKTSTATEHAAAGPSPHNKLALDVLSNHLTPDQMYDPKYKIRYKPDEEEILVTNAQRGWINVILRKNLGNHNVMGFIFNQGIPSVMDQAVGGKKPDKDTLKTMLLEFMIWHASMLQSILDHQSHPDMSKAKKLADLNHQQWQINRRQRKQDVEKEAFQGLQLVNAIESNKRTFQEMSATDLQTLQDYESGKIAQRHAQECGVRMQPFTGRMLEDPSRFQVPET